MVIVDGRSGRRPSQAPSILHVYYDVLLTYGDSPYPVWKRRNRMRSVFARQPLVKSRHRLSPREVPPDSAVSRPVFLSPGLCAVSPAHGESLRPSISFFFFVIRRRTPADTAPLVSHPRGGFALPLSPPCCSGRCSALASTYTTPNGRRVTEAL